MIVHLSKSNRPDKKFQVIIGNKTIHFGQKGYTDFILSGDEEEEELTDKLKLRMLNYLCKIKFNLYSKKLNRYLSYGLGEKVCDYMFDKKLELKQIKKSLLRG